MDTTHSPALALLELDSIAAGIEAADAMVKRAPISLLKTGTVHPGHYLILIGGTVAAVEEAYSTGEAVGGRWLTDRMLLPDVHQRVHDAVLGSRIPPQFEALCVIETRGVPSLLRAADAAIKSTDIQIVEIRLADDLGGRGLLVLDGELADVEDAREIALGRIGPEQTLNSTILPRLDPALRDIVSAGTGFAACKPLEPEGAEQHASG